MKRHLLLGALLFGSILGANAQGNNCAGATEIPDTTTDQIYVVDAVNGTYVGGCFSATATKAEWYKFSPESDGIITVASNIDANPFNNDNFDTRFSIYETSGNCNEVASGTCVGGNDDVSDTDYRSYYSLEVTAGNTYFIVWDNRWLSTGFSWQFTYSAATCFSASGFTYESVDYTEVSISWTEPTIGNPPVGYQYVYVLSGEDMSTGTVVDTADALADMTGLQSGTDYDLYVRTNCDNEDYSTWTGPIGFTTAFEPAPLAYSNSFEESNLNGWQGAVVTGSYTWTRYGSIVDSNGNVELAPSDGDFQMAVIGSTSAAGDVYFVSRPIILPEDNITLSFDIASYALADEVSGSNMTVLVGQDLSDLSTFDFVGEVTGFTGTEYETQTYTFDSPGAGTYYFLFEYTTDAAQSSTTQTALFLDNVNIDVTAGVKGNEVSKLAVYPNPATNVVNISNSGAALINGVNVTDINGRTVKAVSFDGVATAQVNVSDLATGVYMMTINSDKGSVTKKVVKN